MVCVLHFESESHLAFDLIFKKVENNRVEHRSRLAIIRFRITKLQTVEQDLKNLVLLFTVNAMEFGLILVLSVTSITAILAEDISYGTIVVDGKTIIARTDDNFVCATLDWWPPDKCDYNQCPWHYTSVINLNLSHPLLAKAVQAFDRLRIRIGGSLQDQVLYDVGNLKFPCDPFEKMKHGLFGFSKGCLQMKRWDELNRFFNATRVLQAEISFGIVQKLLSICDIFSFACFYICNVDIWLECTPWETQIKRTLWGGDWDSANTQDFIKYSISKGYQIDSWEFGNELSGNGVGAHVYVDQYGKDLIRLKKMIKELYKDSQYEPSLVAPGGFFNQQWFTKLLQVSGSTVLDALSHHIYNLGAGVDPKLVSKILDPNYLNKVANTFINLENVIQKHGPWASAWVGESGGAYNSGGHHVSDTFVNSFWYLDQLGMASKYHTKVYCRQTLIGGNYGLLNATTYVPNPDYYRQDREIWSHSLVMLLPFCDLMHIVQREGYVRFLCSSSLLIVKGKIYVVSIFHSSSRHIRVSNTHYGFLDYDIGIQQAGVTLLMINLSGTMTFVTDVQSSINNIKLATEQQNTSRMSISRSLKNAVSGVGIEAYSDEDLYREEYHLTPKNGYLQSQTMVLNGIPLELTDTGNIPRLDPVRVNSKSPISITPLSITFIVFPDFVAPACGRSSVGGPSPEVNTVDPNSVHPKPEWTAGGIVLLIGKHSERTHRENFRKHFLKRLDEPDSEIVQVHCIII
ncbi:Heparanase-like protein 2 [Hibiscus syriacus]|uniref:Heparanase-like protein 2 n=1 Tax=Hibiscus syriacus TaxID=106335 RepID=A0A6A2WGZ0_HIBSY|nr:Heparanase-like protein 2 [Hibiscus syriacus]